MRATHEYPGGALVITGQQDIRAFRLLTLKGALKLELLGLTGKGGHKASTIIRKEFGFKSRGTKLFDDYCHMLRRIGVLVDGQPVKEAVK